VILVRCATFSEVEDLSGNVTFSNADNAFLSRYTSHMNKVIRTFKRAGNPLDGNTYYLFLIPNPARADL